MNWINYLNVLLAVWLAVAPWVLGYARTPIRLEDRLAALALLSIAALGIIRRTGTRATAAGGLACGLWILFGPWVIGYAERNPLAAINEVWVGFLVALFAAVRLSAVGYPHVE